MRLNPDQRKQIAEIFGNISVAWFSGGIIAPFFFRNQTIQEFAINFIIGLFIGLFFVSMSLQYLKKKRK